MKALIRDLATQQRVRWSVDECGDPIIVGKLGHVYEYSQALLGVMFMPIEFRPRLWANAKKKLQAAGFIVVQNGDEEGAATFDPSNATQASLAIRILRIKRKRVLSAAEVRARRERIAVLNNQRFTLGHVKSVDVAL